MDIFLLKNEFGGYKNIKPSIKQEQDVLVEKYGSKLLDEWKPISFVWDTEDGDMSRDLFLYLGYILVCAKGIAHLFSSLKNSNQIELLPILISGEEFYVVNICSKVEGSLNLKQSKVEYFKDHSIKCISDFVFSNSNNDASLFHIAEFPTPIFCDDLFVAKVKESALTGLKFNKCKQAKNGFFSIFK